MKAYLIAVLLPLLIFGAIGGYLYRQFAQFSSTDFSPPPVTIAASTARLVAWPGYLDTVGTLRAAQGVEMTSKTSGKVVELYFDSGDRVVQGQVLAVLSNNVQQAGRKNQLARLALAELLFERDSELIREQAIPQTQYDRTLAELEQVRAQLAEIEAVIANKSIKTPFAGVMGLRLVNLGDYVSPGTVIATLQNLEALEIDFTVPARHASRLYPGLPVQLRVDGFPGRRFTATLAAIDPRVDPGTRNLLLRARLPQVDGPLPGMFASVRIDLDSARQLVTIPETAMTYSLQGNTVFVIEEAADGQKTAVPRVVESGDVRDGQIAVLQHLEAGEQVVTVGQNKLYRGVRVVIDEQVKM